MNQKSIRLGSIPNSNMQDLNYANLSKLTDREASRRLITSMDFDPSAFLEHQVSAISMDGGDPEQKLYNLFDAITNHLTTVSKDIDEEADVLREAAEHMEGILFEELEEDAIKLEEVHESVDTVKFNFETASDNAIKIGSRLQNSEKERLNIVKSIQLLSYIHDFQKLSDSVVDTILSMNASKLRNILPKPLQRQEWIDISKVLHDLKKIVTDLSAEDIQKAQKVISNVSEVVENELLGQFDEILLQIMEENSKIVYNLQAPPVSGFDSNQTMVVVDEQLIQKARHLTDCLHLFNNGQSLQKRYIFTVIQRRIPNNVFSSPQKGTTLTPGQTAAGNLFQRLNHAITGQDLGDDFSSAGASSDHNHSDDSDNEDAGGVNRVGSSSPEETKAPMQLLTKAAQTILPPAMNTFLSNALNFTDNNNNPLQLVDQLSNLFTIIDKVCREQFEIIRKIFPPNTVARVTRLLVQRIFGDPAFGIQAKVDSILCPQPPAPPLPISDYLDALLTVREKLSALHLLLIECSLDPALVGMGSESESLRRAKNEGWMKFRNQSVVKERRESHGRRGSHGGNDEDSRGDHSHGKNSAGGGSLLMDLEDSDEKIRSDAEIKEFLEEQITQVLASYMNDYFDKEMNYVRSQYIQAMQGVIDESSPAFKASSNSSSSSSGIHPFPPMKVDRLKTVANIHKLIGNKGFMNSIFNITADAVLRMESIGRDDKKIFLYLKNLYQQLLYFLTEGVIIPMSKATTTFLLRQASSKPTESVLPPMEYLSLLSTIIYTKGKLKTMFDEHFLKLMKEVPNYITICKEARLKAGQSILTVCKESLHAWTLGIALHLDKLFLTLQGKYDYAPKNTMAAVNNLLMKTTNGVMLPTGSSSSRYSVNQQSVSAQPTSACNTVCKAMIFISQAVRNIEKEINVGMDLEKLFWKPLGQQFIGSIISNIRRYKITIEGGRVLLADLEEFHSLTGLMTSMETMDMMVCLLDICKIFLVEDGDEVLRMVVEDLRHLDVAIVLGLVQCRSDFSLRSNGTWAKILSTSFSNYKWDTPLPWETKKPLSVMSFAESMNEQASDNPNIRPLGPKTLRREATSLSALYLADLTGHRSSSSHTINPRVSIDHRNQVVSLDLSLLEENLSNAELQKHIKAAELQELQRSQTGGQKVHSKFLPMRPGEESSSSSASSNHFMGSNGIDDGMSKRGSESLVMAAVQRPDLIGIRSDSLDGRTKSTSSLQSSFSSAGGGEISQSNTMKRKSQVDGNSNSNSNGAVSFTGNNPMARRSVTESSSTATLSATMKSPSQNGNSGGHPISPGGGAPRPMGMLQKMSSFFSRK